jgi:YHS domain-containing protein
MKWALCILMILSLVSCANRREHNPATQSPVVTSAPAEYNGQCAMGMCLKKNVVGTEKYSVDYKGKHYIFSSEEARDKFLSNIDANIKRANKQWEMSSADRKR